LASKTRLSVAAGLWQINTIQLAILMFDSLVLLGLELCVHFNGQIGEIRLTGDLQAL
jgi:hypothetical protein